MEGKTGWCCCSGSPKQERKTETQSVQHKKLRDFRRNASSWKQEDDALPAFVIEWSRKEKRQMIRDAFDGSNREWVSLRGEEENYKLKWDKGCMFLRLKRMTGGVWEDEDMHQRISWSTECIPRDTHTVPVTCSLMQYLFFFVLLSSKTCPLSLLSGEQSLLLT